MADQRTIPGEPLDETKRFTLHQICHICGTGKELIIEMVREGIIEPEDRTQDKWEFSGVAVTRIQTALRLQRDLDVNLPGVALALELLEEIERLERRIRR